MAPPPTAVLPLLLPMFLMLLVLAYPDAASGQAGRREIVSGPATTRPRSATLAIALSIKSRAIQDSRCYLMNGGAVESFFIGENTPVGSVIGTLSVNGDPREGIGDVVLTIQEKDPAVGLAPGSKNVTLLRALDREERTGPSSVYVNVRCTRTGTADPSFVVPVSVRVWDENDNAPIWVGAPYRVRLSELTAPGSRVAPTMKAADADQPGPHATLKFEVLPGPNSDFFTFPNELESVLVLAKPLDYETTRNMTVMLRASDHGSPPRQADVPLIVEVLDADDQNPAFSHDHYTALLPELAQEGTILQTAPGPISAADQDVGINAPLVYSATGEARRLVSVARDTGLLAATTLLLREPAPVTLVLKATQVDNPDRYALATVTISRSGYAATPVQFSRRQYTASVPEDTAPGTVLLTLHTDPRRPVDAIPLQFYVSDRSFLERFAINSAGELVLRRALDYEARKHYHYQVMVTDGAANDTASLNISVVNVNEWEPRFRHALYEFRVGDSENQASLSGNEGTGELMPVGLLDVFDGDADDTVSISLSGPDADALVVERSGAVLVRRGALASLQAPEPVLRATATATDSGAPPRQSSVPLVVHVSGRLQRATPRWLPALAAAAALAAVVLAVLLYLHRRRRAKTSAENKQDFSRQEKPRAPSALAAAARSGTLEAENGATLASSAGSLLSVSAGASTILANSTSSLDLAGENQQQPVPRQSQRFTGKSRVAPMPPTLPPDSAVGIPAGNGIGTSGAMSDHLAGRGGRSGVAWPATTIPARVKKLSWDDTALDTQHNDRGVLEATNTAVAHPHSDHMNLTVYF